VSNEPGNRAWTYDHKIVAVEFRHSWAGWAPKDADHGRDPLRLHQPATITAPRKCISRQAMCRDQHRSKILRRRSRNRGADPQPPPLKTFRWEAPDVAVRSPACSRCAPSVSCPVQRPWVVGRRGVARVGLDPKLEMWTVRRAGGREGIEESPRRRRPDRRRHVGHGGVFFFGGAPPRLFFLGYGFRRCLRTRAPS